MTTDEGHVGVLAESEYGFWCWVVCSCGWRSRSYNRSAQAWTAHMEHATGTER
jgi:hypothetical protein